MNKDTITGEGAWPAPAGALLALAYLISGKLGLMLALPPGYASAIFPPVGIAIAAVLVAGRGVLPWVFLGSLALNLWVGLGQGAPAVAVAAATLIAGASTLQAALGGSWLRRALPAPISLDSGRDLLVFLASAPLVCLTSASLSVLGLVGLGALPAAELAVSWATWWVGDTIGLIVMLPLALVAIGQPRSLWRVRLVPVALPMLLVFALVVFAYINASQWELDDLAHHAGRVAAHRGWQAWSVLALGLFGTGLLGALLLLGTGQASYSRRLVAERTRELAKSESVLAQAGRIAHLGAWEVDLANVEDVDANPLTWSDETFRIFGYAPGAVEPSNALFFEHVHPDDRQKVRDAVAQAFAARRDYQIEHRIRRADGSERTVFEHADVTYDDQGQPLRMIGAVRDITAHKAAEEKLRLAASVFEEAREGIIIADAEGCIVDINRAFWELTGYTKREVLGQNPRLLKSGHHDDEFYAGMWRSLTTTGHWEGEIWNRRRDGEIVAAQMAISAVRDDAGAISHYIALFSDVTERKRQQERIEHLAYHDALTRLPNRVLLADRMQQALARAARNGSHVAVCYLDLDGFKPINDQFGHKTGDRVLVEIARRLQASTRNHDTVARLGGDEFVLLLTDLGSFTESDVVLTRVLQAVAQPLAVKTPVAVSVSASIGVTLYPGDGGDPDTLLRHADQAMYLAKQEGRNRVHLFDPGHDRKIDERRKIRHRVRDALKHGQLVLYWQPQIDMQQGRVIGAEALLRWPQADGSVALPASFLPALEDDDLIVRIGEWVIDQALTTLAGWLARGHDLSVSVNIAARQLRSPKFCATVEKALAHHPTVAADRLELEIVETAALEDMGQMREVVERCAEMGVGFALDDFGTGYSSMTCFRQLPTRTVKIDQSFVRHMLKDKEDRAIVEGILGMTAAFGKEAIAEGVEQREQGLALLELGCHVAQGYGLGPPMAEAEFLDWLARFKAGPAWAAEPVV